MQTPLVVAVVGVTMLVAVINHWRVEDTERVHSISIQAEQPSTPPPSPVSEVVPARSLSSEFFNANEFAGVYVYGNIYQRGGKLLTSEVGLFFGVSLPPPQTKGPITNLFSIPVLDVHSLLYVYLFRAPSRKVLIRNGDGPQLDTILHMFYTEASSVCGGAECVHGIRRVLTDCTCECDPHWSGALCSYFDCHGHGQYDPGSQQCACEPGFESATGCAARWCDGTLLYVSECPLLAASTLDSDQCHGRGVRLDGRCVCVVPGATGLFCESLCATNVMDPVACPLRLNWGHDLDPADGPTAFGVCGGGYTDNPARMRIVYLECTAADAACAATWAAEAATCCSPYVDCTVTPCSPIDLDCCARYATPVACGRAGCAWCAEGGLCAAADLALNCTQPAHLGVQGHWRAHLFACSSTTAVTASHATACDLATRDSYLALYADCSTPDCLEAARVLVNTAPWPRLQPDGYTSTGAVHVLLNSSRMAAVARGVGCDPGSQLRLVMDPTHLVPGSLGAAALWACSPHYEAAAVLALVRPTADYELSAFQVPRS